MGGSQTPPTLLTARLSRIGISQPVPVPASKPPNFSGKRLGRAKMGAVGSEKTGIIAAKAREDWNHSCKSMRLSLPLPFLANIPTVYLRVH